MSTKRKYRLLSALLALLLIVGALAGCGQGKEDSSSSETETSESSSETEKETDASEESDEESDTSEEEVSGGITFPYTGDPVVYKGYAYEGPDQDPELLCNKEWREHIGNISIEYEYAAYSDYMEKANVYLATNDIPDVLPVSDTLSVTRQYGVSGCLLDFNQYADYMPNLQEYRKQYPSMDYICNSSGERFAIQGVQPFDKTGECYFVNMDVLEAAQQEVPDTLDEMIDVMRAVKAYDPTIIPWQSYWNLDYTMQWFARLTGAKKELIYYDTEDGTYKCSYREESAKRKELIELLATMYAEGLINPQIVEESFEQEQSDLASGKWAFSAVFQSSFAMEIFKIGVEDELPIKIEPMLPPEGWDGKRLLPLSYMHDNVGGWGIVCSSDAEHPELLAAYMDQVVSPYARDLFNCGVEGVTFDYIDGIPTKRDGITNADYGIGSQYEVWTIGMGALANVPATLEVRKASEFCTDNFVDGTVEAAFLPQVTVFTPENATEQANLENSLMTYINENEAKFIYGQRSMDEWDAYVQEVESVASIDDLLALYEGAETIVRDPERIFTLQ